MARVEPFACSLCVAVTASMGASTAAAERVTVVNENKRVCVVLCGRNVGFEDMSMESGSTCEAI